MNTKPLAERRNNVRRWRQRVRNQEDDLFVRSFGVAFDRATLFVNGLEVGMNSQDVKADGVVRRVVVRTALGGWESEGGTGMSEDVFRMKRQLSRERTLPRGLTKRGGTLDLLNWKVESAALEGISMERVGQGCSLPLNPFAVTRFPGRAKGGILGGGHSTVPSGAGERTIWAR